MRLRTLTAVILTALAASGCRVHLVGDSTAAFVQAHAAAHGFEITGSPEPGCGYSSYNGNRRVPGSTGPGYPSCVIDWVNAELPDDPGDVIIAFVSLHDAMCSTVDGCLPPDVAAYSAADAHIRTSGHGVVWVDAPPLGNQQLRDRIAALNEAVADELGCDFVSSNVRVAETYDGIHYTETGALVVGARLAVLAENPPLC